MRKTASFPLNLKHLVTGLVIGLSLALFQNLARADDSVMEVITLQNRPVTEIQPLLSPLLESNEAITGEGFNLIVKAQPNRLESIRSLVKQLDTRLRNLNISVLQTSNKSAEQLNAEAAIAATPSAIQMHGMTGDTRDVNSQRTAQQLRTLEGQPAHIEVGQIRPVENYSMYNSRYGYSGIAVNTQLQQASTGFAVIPRLQGDNEVIVDIAPWSDRFLGNNWITTQSVQTSVRARLGEWIEIGGTGEQAQTDRQGFTGFNYSTQKNELKILIKVDLAD